MKAEERRIRAWLDNLAKPRGSLGIWERQVEKVLLVWRDKSHELSPKHIIFAADNGVVRAGVVSQLAEVTYVQSRHMLAGTAAVACFCRCNNISYEVVDVGIAHPQEVGVGRKIAQGTHDFSLQPAMSKGEVERALHVGAERVRVAQQEGYNLLSFGEMGIGNTTTSAAVLGALVPQEIDTIVGYGASQGNYGLVLKKKKIIVQALQRYQSEMHGIEDILRCVGGFDIAALTGAMLACANVGIPFFIDGFITAVALACAVSINASVRDVALLSHISREPGMSAALRYSGMDIYEAPLQGELALGEGTGAILAVILLRTVLYTVFHMGSMETLNQEARKIHQQRRRDEDG